MVVLVTGGAGYIGSHTVVELLASGHQVVIVDNLANASMAVLGRIAEISGQQPLFINADVGDEQAMRLVFQAHQIDAVIHFAGFKAVGESAEIPLSYYQNNVSSSVVLFQLMAEFGCKNLVFSSSATVYGAGNDSPLNEQMATSATNPYGRTKLMVEEILKDVAQSDHDWHIVLLRYFNPIGAHESGLIGEDPKGIPNNLLPYVAKVAVGQLAQLSVYGDDYDTADGTGVRDYIHVVDLANGHVKALEKLASLTGCHAINLGTGNGTSVLDIVNKFAQISGNDIPYKIVPRRTGDLACVYANATKAFEVLNWTAERDLEQMITDAWRWQSGNPKGYCQ